ncbi:hypothetical protein QFC19_007763 [Naganishia cerealis]|uniref:Uncharacterized protein n=1 Tax=Naganishia cerealis TaxID=610337 RepID=A0ACC2V8L3_9TREE|nr:hypothetical protein QFC19_007763 [Naganishia cerealis]
MVIPYKGDLSLQSLLSQCQISPTDSLDNSIIAGKHRAIDVKKLGVALSNIDRESLSARRRNFNELYQEAKLEEEPGKGLSFQTALLLLARYQLIDESEALP